MIYLHRAFRAVGGLRRVAAFTLTAAMAFCASAIAADDGYPSKPVRMVVPFPPGGATDNLARALAPKFGEFLGQQVIVDNKAGANTIVGAELVAKAPADGYTVLMTIDSTLSINPSLYAKLPYDPLEDFMPVTVIATVPQVLVVHSSVPAKNIDQLLALARAKPGGLNYASIGTGSPQQLLMELLKSLTKTDFVHIPYKGGAPATTDLLGGQVQLLIGSVPTNLPHIQSGKLRALGVTGATRFSGLPDVPTMSESVPGYDVNVLFGLLVPSGTQPAVIAKLRSAMVSALQDAALRKRLTEQAFQPVGGTPEEFAAIIRKDTARWARVIKEAGIRGE